MKRSRSVSPEIPPSPDIDGVYGSPRLPCGCAGAACAFGEDEREPGEGVADVDADRCGELGWREVARTVDEIDFLILEDRRVRVLEDWVEKVVAPRWRQSEGRWGLDPEAFANISRIVHRVSGCPIGRCKIQWWYKPALRFVMKHPRDANPNAAASIMIKMPSPVGWIEADRDASGALSYRYDGGRVPVDMRSITKDGYGKTWAEKAEPSPMPVFAHPRAMESTPPGSRHCYVYSPGVGGWVAAKRDDEDGTWMQALEGTDIKHPVYDVPGDEYGKDFGVLAPLYDGNLDRVYDRLVLHPQYDAKWIGAYTGRDGKLYCYGYPSDVEVRADLSPDNFNRTWCWPPSAAD